MTNFFLLLMTVFLQRISCRFLLRLKTIIGCSAKACLKSLSVFNISQCLFTAVFKDGRVRLYVSISGILFDAAWCFSFSRWTLSIVNVFEICRCISLYIIPLCEHSKLLCAISFCSTYSFSYKRLQIGDPPFKSFRVLWFLMKIRLPVDFLFA